jgi:hypothetical protein
MVNELAHRDELSSQSDDPHGVDEVLKYYSTVHPQRGHCCVIRIVHCSSASDVEAMTKTSTKRFHYTDKTWNYGQSVSGLRH